MASIGVVMFGKAVVLAVSAAVVERYRSFKARRRSTGVTLRYDVKRNTYYDPLERLEKRAKIALWIVAVPTALYAALVVYLLVTGPAIPPTR